MVLLRFIFIYKFQEFVKQLSSGGFLMFRSYYTFNRFPTTNASATLSPTAR